MLTALLFTAKYYVAVVKFSLNAHVLCTGSLITGMGPEESGIYNNDWLPPHSGTLPDVSPVSGAGKVS